MSLSYKTIRPLLLTGTSTSSRWLSYAGLAIGVLLLLCSIQMFINIQQLLERNNVRKGGYDFISITKTVTNENMGQDNRFDINDINELKAQPFIENAAALTPNRFKVMI